MAFKHGEAIKDNNPMPIVSIGSAGPFKIGEPPSLQNPLPVKDISSLAAGGQPYQFGEARSDHNPWPCSDYVVGGTSSGNSLSAEDAADVFPDIQRGEPHDDGNPLPVKIVASFFFGDLTDFTYKQGEAISDSNPLPIKIFT